MNPGVDPDGWPGQASWAGALVSSTWITQQPPASRAQGRDREGRRAVSDTHCDIAGAPTHTHPPTHDTDTKVEANKRRRIQARTRPL